MIHDKALTALRARLKAKREVREERLREELSELRTVQEQLLSDIATGVRPAAARRALENCQRGIDIVLASLSKSASQTTDQHTRPPVSEFPRVGGVRWVSEHGQWRAVDVRSKEVLGVELSYTAAVAMVTLRRNEYRMAEIQHKLRPPRWGHVRRGRPISNERRVELVHEYNKLKAQEPELQLKIKPSFM